MKTNRSKSKTVKTTIAYLIIMAAILIIANTAIQDSGTKNTTNILTIVVILLLIVMEWIMFSKSSRRIDENEGETSQKKEASGHGSESVGEFSKIIENTTRTGAVCMATGIYRCSSHEFRSIHMEKGKKFPPCRGDKKGHSSTWLLQEQQEN